MTGTANGRLREIISEVHVSIPSTSVGLTASSVKMIALWDTGATGSVVTKATAKALGLAPISQANSVHAGGISRVNVYLIDIYLPNKIKLSNVKVTECEDSVGRFGMIIGMDIITLGDFAITNVGNKTTFSYRIPSVQTIDYVKDPEPPKKPVVNTVPKVGRNDPCPCGSNKKYKNCHGAKT